MTRNTSLGQMYQPTHDEKAKQAFVGTLKGIVNGPVEADLARLYDRTIEPAFVSTHGHAPKHRDDVIPAFEAEPLYQTWGSLVQTSQDLMWETVGDTVDRLHTEFEARASEITSTGKAGGTVRLNPDLVIPKPIADVEIHRQPGNYFFENDGTDLTTGMLYMGTIELYRTAKGLGTGAKVGEASQGKLIAAQVAKRYPDLKPKRILDMGCAIGTETVAYKEQWPDAEVHGLDLSGPMVRFAHAWAEDKGLEIHYHQLNAAETDFPDGHFDLIVAHILFHETWHDVQDQIMAEIHRLLAPGGVFLTGDVPYQPSRIPMTKQVTNAWQNKHNGEPYWTGFADRNMRDDLAAAGFDEDKTFADYVPIGAGFYYYFGASKAA